MQDMKSVIESAVVLNELKDNIENFLKESYDEFEKTEYKKVVEESQKEKTNSPFLSIVVRTQGRREESLREVFLCLEGQENQDFEVLLIGHKLNEVQYKLVQTIVEQQSDDMRAKVRYIPLDYGNRTTPLNIGFAKAWGEYIVTLDDDDIVLDNWVSNFHHGAKKYPGKVIYNYAFAQNWSVIDGGAYDGGLRAESAFDPEFAHDYNDVTQVELNRCPPVGLAYPSVAFQKMGIIFDESLATTEDWDYLMRVAYVCGVYSVDEPACIYRKWINAETSFTVHKKEEWERNYDTIVKKIQNKMLCIPVGGTETIYNLIKDRTWLINKTDADAYVARVFGFERMYFKVGENYSEDAAMCASEIEVKQNGDFTLTYLLDEEYREAAEIRWDPIEKGILLLSEMTIKLVLEDDTEVMVEQESIRHNGKSVNEYIYFAQEDPQILFGDLGSRNVKTIIMSGKVREDIPLEVYEKIISEECEKSVNEMREQMQSESLIQKLKRKFVG